MNEQMFKNILHDCNETADLYLTKQCSPQIELAPLNSRTRRTKQQAIVDNCRQRVHRNKQSA